MSGFGKPFAPEENVIRITAEDAASPHVDDLLKRQASLRGEGGITASRRRRWFYSNWFVFSMAGIFGALAAWCLLEPHFDDYLYVQGRVEAIGQDLPLADRIAQLQPDLKVVGSITIHRDPILVFSLTKEIDERGKVKPFDLTSIQVGDEIGVFVEYAEHEEGSIAVAVFVDRQPAARAPTPPIDELQVRQVLAGLLLFPVVAALVGLAIGAADGLVCRLWRRLLIGGMVGLLVGFIGGFVSQIFAGFVYLPINALAAQQLDVATGQISTLGFLTQMSGRGLAWLLAGMAMGLGHGIAMRSGRILLYGFLGGLIGGLLGGLLFDPIDLLLLGPDKPSSHWSRLIGLCVIGASVGGMIGVVELLARDAWLNMVRGPLAGKEFLVFKDVMHIGASPRSDIYLFNDADVAERHATIRAAGDQYEIESVDRNIVMVNGRQVARARLRHGDQITFGRTVFSFQRRRRD